jgi:hypothetical protein
MSDEEIEQVAVKVYEKLSTGLLSLPTAFKMHILPNYLLPIVNIYTTDHKDYFMEMRTTATGGLSFRIKTNNGDTVKEWVMD